jgi:hypothetical protein
MFVRTEFFFPVDSAELGNIMFIQKDNNAAFVLLTPPETQVEPSIFS